LYENAKTKVSNASL